MNLGCLVKRGARRSRTRARSGENVPSRQIYSTTPARKAQAVASLRPRTPSVSYTALR
jgi:hypothetical protein